MTASDGTADDRAWKEAVLSIVQGSGSSGSFEQQDNAIKVKKLRKQVLLSMQLDESDKTAKKTFKRIIKALEESQELSLDVDGNVTLTRKGKKRKSKDEKKKAKKESKKRKHEKEIETENPTEENDEKQTNNDNDNEESLKDKNKPCKGNPQGVTRLFLGNLPFAVDETSMGSFLHDKVTHIKWITDKDTGKFYGSAFVEMQDSSAAADAVAMAGQSLMGRPIKINFAAARPGDKWPPEKRVITGGAAAATTSNTHTTTGGQAGGKGVKAMSEKPNNCVKLFIGNLSYDIDDEGITKFFENVGAEVKAVRWLHHKDSGDFKGW